MQSVESGMKMWFYSNFVSMQSLCSLQTVIQMKEIGEKCYCLLLDLLIKHVFNDANLCEQHSVSLYNK